MRRKNASRPGFRFPSPALRLRVSAVMLACLALSGCASPERNPGRVRLVSWNVQTFFDAQTSGLEYPDFRGNRTRWCLQMYEERLDRLCQAAARLDADVLVLQEVESEAVMYDIVNRMYGYFPRNKSYGYMCFAAEEGSAIGCGILSRLPLGKTTAHQLDVRTHGEQPQLRPLLELDVHAEAVPPGAAAFRLFVCHWKSKSGGAEEASLWQKEQEAVLAARLSSLLKSPVPAVVCGDFNRDLREFSGKDGRVLLGGVAVESGWLVSGAASGKGSYFYKDSWERIDHFFTAGNISLERFAAVSDGPWSCLDDSGETIPFGFTVWSGQGWSDHFPVECVVALK